MHRLTQAILRDRLTPACASATRERTEAILAAGDPGEPPDPATWARWAQLTPHVLAADLAATDNHALRNLVRRVCWYLIERGDARTPRELMSELHRQWSARLGQDHEDTLMAAHYLAWSLLELGRYAEAHDLNRDTWERRCHVLGEGHPDTLNSAHNLALVLRLLGDLRAARDLNQDTWQRHRQALRPRPSQHAAHCPHPRGRPPRTGRGGRRPRPGPRHPRSSPARPGPRPPRHPELRLQPGGRPPRPWRCPSRPRPRPRHPQRRQRLLGEDHPDTLESAHNLAADLRELGELTAARDLDRDTLERRRRVLGQDHPDTLSSARNLDADLRGTRET